MNLNVNETLYTQISEVNATMYKVCIAIPTPTTSDGIWGGQISGRTPLKSFLPLFDLQVIVIYAVTFICQYFLKHLNFPVFISQMLAGLILGSSIQQETVVKYKLMLFPYGSQEVLTSITSIGYAFFMFLTTVQMDFSMITRTGCKPWAIAMIGLAAPLVFCIPTFLIFHTQFHGLMGYAVKDLHIVLLSQTVLSTAVIASLLNELKITNSELGRLALSSVLVSDLVTTTITSFTTALTESNEVKHLVVNLVALVALCIFILFVCRPAMFWIIKQTPEGRAVKDGYIYLIISMVLVSGWVVVQIEQDFILGPFIFGLAVPEGPPLGSALVKKLNVFCTCLLLPIFVTCSVMKTDLSFKYLSAVSSVVIIVLVIVTHLLKITACTVVALYCKMPFKDALALALILNAKGIVEVGLYNGLYDAKVITVETYGIMMLSIMIAACIVKWSVKYLYDPSRKYAGYQTRNIMSLTADSELKVIACIHKQCHISSIIDVLDLCCPTTEQPIIVDVLHLIELVGRCTPIFISHRLQRTTSETFSHKSYSDEIILTFDFYALDNPGAVTAQAYTSISQANLMHDDVCQLALDKVASIIILPFHQKLSADGEIEFDDKNIRSLNCKVLEIAPCSVGILVSRATFQSGSQVRLAMVFLGGKDDREAFCLAKRAMRNPRISLVVYHIVHKEYMPDIEDVIDKDTLEDIQQAHSSLENVSYRQIIANDGQELSAFLRDIVDGHDFFIVGRRHGISSPQIHGLSDWSEFSELGVIGDLLASTDFGIRASLLVVQQQVKDE
ncbi:hypothetical protein TanjilG_14812 [Lupinus angustifolius]|uniref:Cation/H+ exchanger domain-containing protein n=1 Tax=Lupinus angustifolius TaxID=3871 RepID=A0A1J7H250_LUPAN|nr:PREDICTED: cation/H(+) antiporter 4-like [Lupinus angustifolius]OIW00586.1 hypothetical protein TanjilG_14812 [Lupinus angustifolius]